MSKSPKALELILINIETLDNEMTLHQNGCLECSEAPCKEWENMVETWNFYYLSLARTTKNNLMEIQYE